MKSLTKLMAMGLLSVGLAACSSDDNAVQQQDFAPNGADKVFMSLNLSYPSTRANTNKEGTPGVEVGQNGENLVSTVQVILCSEDGQTIAASNVGQFGAGEGQISGPVAQGTMYTATFDAEDLLALAGQSNVKVYAICNGSIDNTLLATQKEAGLALDIQKLVKAGSNEMTALAGAKYWQNNGFLMSNADGPTKLTKAIPTQAELLKNSASKDKAFDLGSVVVERAAARFDYQEKAGNANSVYKVAAKETPEKAVAYVDLDDYSIVNISNSFYTLGRNNAVANAAASEAVLGRGKYMVGTNWDWILAGDATVSPEDHMIQHTYATPNVDKKGNVSCYVGYEYKGLDALKNGQKDNWEGQPADRNEYYFMAYAPENTIPAPATKPTSIMGAATGVVFRGAIKAIEGVTPESLKTAINSTDPLITYHGILLGTWDVDVKKIAANGVSGDHDPFKGNPSELANFKMHYEIVNAALTPEGKIKPSVAKQNGFEIYDVRPETNIHEVYYPFFNMHSADMKYGVVRNNVYKLRISNIMTYGLPRNTSIDPNKPIDNTDIFFEVSVDVLPWAVKVNDIEF